MNPMSPMSPGVEASRLMHREPWLQGLCRFCCFLLSFLLSSILLAFQTEVRRIPAALRTQHAQQPLEHIHIPHEIHNSNNLSNDLSNLHDVKLTSFSESAEIFPGSTRSTSTKSISSTRTPRTTTHPPLIPALIPGQSALPWTPVSLDAKGIEQLELGINFSLACNASCRANRFMCEEHEISRCFGMDCQCSSGFLLPAESKTLPLKGPRFAIVLAGMTRSFFSTLMNEFWRLFLARFDGDLVLFAVLTTISSQKFRGTGLTARKDQVWSKFTVKELREALENLNVTWDAAFVEDATCGWQVARQYVQDPTLRAMLDVKAKFPGEGGQNNLFRARVIAFDRILRYEVQTGQRFRQLLVLRPDFAPYLGHDDPAFVVSSVKGSVYAYNDLINIFERKFATYVFTEPATIRSSFTTLDKDAWQVLLWKLWNRSNTHHTVLLPNAHWALHGVPICGAFLQAIPDIPCTSWNFEVNATMGFIRDRWRVKGPQHVCVDRLRGAPLKFIKDYFRRLGMNQSLVEDLSLCMPVPKQMSKR